jgi:hypothetical protein
MNFSNREVPLKKSDFSMRSRGWTGVGLLSLLWIPACQGPGRRGDPAPALSREKSIQQLNENAAKLVHGLRSRGMAMSGRMMENGKPRSFDFRGVMLFVPPHHFWMEMQHLGEPVMQIGANEKEYWAWAKGDLDKMWAGHRDSLGESFEESMIPIHPDHLVESLGLATIATGGSSGPAYLVDADYNRLIFLAVDDQIGAHVSRTYFIDRRPPHMIRKIVFRRDDGTELMTAKLDDHRPVGPDGPLLARRIHVDWPETDSYLDVHIGPTATNLLGKTDQWETLTTDHPYFIRPTGAGEIEWLDKPDSEPVAATQPK